MVAPHPAGINAGIAASRPDQAAGGQSAGVSVKWSAGYSMEQNWSQLPSPTHVHGSEDAQVQLV